MRTSIEINKELLDEVMELSCAATTNEVVELALQEYINHLKRQNMKNLFGKVIWDDGAADVPQQ